MTVVHTAERRHHCSALVSAALEVRYLFTVRLCVQCI